MHRKENITCKPLEKSVLMYFREILFGLKPIRSDWLESGFVFRDVNSAFPYGLIIPKKNTRGLIICVNAHVLKYLLFKQEGGVKCHFETLLKPDQGLQADALVNSLSEIIWRAGDSLKSRVCAREKIESFFSRFTDELMVYEFNEYQELVNFIRTHLPMFQSKEGCLLFFYSVILTKGQKRLSEEMNEESKMLLTSNGDLVVSALNLMLTGKATPYLHNGVAYTSDEEAGTTKELLGIEKRSEIGLLLWQTDDEAHPTQIGSRLKTPSFPIWITRVKGDQYGILFNPMQDLIRDYHAERRFDLHYYSSARTQIQPTILNVDTRYTTHRDECPFQPPLACLILTKWHGAQVDWNGTNPFI